MHDSSGPFVAVAVLCLGSARFENQLDYEPDGRGRVAHGGPVDLFGILGLPPMTPFGLSGGASAPIVTVPAPPDEDHPTLLAMTAFVELRAGDLRGNYPIGARVTFPTPAGEPQHGLGIFSAFAVDEDAEGRYEPRIRASIPIPLELRCTGEHVVEIVHGPDQQSIPIPFVVAFDSSR